MSGVRLPTDTALDFFSLVFPHLPGLLCVFELPGRQARYFEERKRAAEWAVSRRRTQDIYFAISLLRERPKSGRGDEALTCGIPGVWADIDVRGPAHRAENLPPTIEAARDLLSPIGAAPTAVVHSGHGLQAYWLFKDLWIFASEEDRSRAKALVVGWQALLRRLARDRGWTIDPTADLARLLRVPGTFNRKLANAVQFVDYEEVGARYTPREIEGVICDRAPAVENRLLRPEKRSDGSPADLDLILEVCGWMRHCRDDAESLPEPAWYQMLTIVARCGNAERHAHALSKAYPHYTEVETSRKLKQALESAPGPVSCQYVEMNLDGTKFCSGCAVRGKIRSPIQVGRLGALRCMEGASRQDIPDELVAVAVGGKLDAALSEHDLALVCKLIPELSLLPPVEYLPLRSRIQCEFGRGIRMSDFDREVQAERARQHRLSRTSGSAWKSRLPMKDNIPRPVLLSALQALREAPEWEGVLAFDEFAETVTFQKTPPGGRCFNRKWSDNDDRLTAEWLQARQIFVSPDVAAQAVQVIAREHKFHPVREYFGRLKWDGRARVGAWLESYLGAKPNEYSAQVGSKWLISAVARIFEPGCKADCCLILEGNQGTFKSRALEILGGDWFVGEIAELGTKDAALQLRGAWIIEISELDGLSRGDVSAIKAFMSRCVDRFRPPYARHIVESPRSCVFAGTVNHNQYLRDETGGRRFWPVACGPEILVAALERDRDQIWAEAKHLYDSKQSWWLESSDLNRMVEREVSGRYRSDPWDDRIAAWAANRDEVTILQVLEECIQKRICDCSQGDANRVARSLTVAGWKRCRARRDSSRPGGRPWVYRNPAFFEQGDL